LRASDSGVHGKMFGAMKDEKKKRATKKLNNEHFNLYSSPNIIRMIKARRIR
jgi:hypothetical protein